MAFYFECYSETQKKKREKKERDKEKGSCAGLTLVRLTGLTQQSLCVDETTVVSDIYNPRRKNREGKLNRFL